MIRRTTLIAAATVLTACSDPAGPCDGTYACEVSGVDLAIVDARIIDGEHVGRDRVTGLPIYAPGPVSVAFTIVNRGDSTSLPQPFGNSEGDVLQPLRPGESVQVVVTEDFTDAMHIQYLRPTMPLDARAADRRTIGMYLNQRPPDDELDPDEYWPVYDADLSNNTRESPAFHVAMPVLRASIADIEEVRANQPFVSSFRIDNVSVHGADAGAFDVVLCTWDFDIGCYGEWWTFFGRFKVPGVEAGWKYENAYVTEMDHASMVWAGEAHSAWIVMCIVAADHDRPYINGPLDCITGTSAATIFRPNYESCNPPLLQPGVPLVLTAPNCNNPDPNRAFSVVAIDVVAGHPYTLEGASVDVYDADGERAALSGPGLTFQESGRYYIVVQRGVVTLTLSA